MNDEEINHFGKKLRAAIPPIRRSELARDLWPEFLQRMRESPSRIPWFDWALAALAASTLIFFPEVIPALLYHF